MIQNVTLLGATGSIGSSTISVLRRYPKRFRLHAISGGNRVAPLVQLAREFRPKRVVIADPSKYWDLKVALQASGLFGIETAAGPQAVIDLASDPATDVVLQAIVGAAGLAPTFAAARAGKRLLLANKESVVCGGALLMKTVRDAGAVLLPVDSEHSAIFQCLVGATPEARQRATLTLTASGGPFRGWRDLSGVTPEMAVKHPKWSMGQKISVDSASLMNKGLEVIEARWLFGMSHERIHVVVHPQSIIHSMVNFADGAVMAQMGMPDMQTPIAYALTYPDRVPLNVEPLNLAKIGSLTFEEPDLQTFPLLRMAYEALEANNGLSIVLNAANEVAVEAFLNRQVSFTGMFTLVERTCSTIHARTPQTLAEILDIDQHARAYTRSLLQG